MSKHRLEAFTDGVLAIIITIMILEMEVPKTINYQEIMKLISDLIIYLISYVYVGIYWNNHHHLLSTVEQVNGRVLWTNLTLLFFLSLIPFATKWINDGMSAVAVIFYGLTLLLSAMAYYLLIKSILKSNNNVTLSIYQKHGFKKEIISIILYILGIISVFVSPYISLGFYIIVALLWIIPDKKIERTLKN